MLAVIHAWCNHIHDSPAAAAGDTTGEIGSAHTEVLYLPAEGPSPCRLKRNLDLQQLAAVDAAAYPWSCCDMEVAYVLEMVVFHM